MKKLQVLHNGWGERWQLGTLLDTGKLIVFEYSAAAIERGLELSPLHHPLPRPGAASVVFKGAAAFHGLPGFIADALPDGWGMLLMDRALRKAGRDPRGVSVLERLAVVGDRAIGALSFEPAQDQEPTRETLQLKALAAQIALLQADGHANASHTNAGPAGPADTQLRLLLRLGGSPQGARPKVLVDFNARTGVVSTGLPPTGSATPWLVKFPAEAEHREVCAVEEFYARTARAMGLDMPRSRFFELGRNYSAFGVERFDRVMPIAVRSSAAKDPLRVPVASLSALLQADHRLPSLDYETLLLATLRLTGDQREVLKAFERCVFNVLMNNRDDHSRNFAYRMNVQGLWQLSPAFDLTFSDGPGGEHSTSVAGHGKNITRAHLMQVAASAGIKPAVAARAVDHCLDAITRLPRLVRELPIRRATLAGLRRTIDAHARSLR